jgi:hypothetical protein
MQLRIWLVVPGELDARLCGSVGGVVCVNVFARVVVSELAVIRAEHHVSAQLRVKRAPGLSVRNIARLN